LFQHLSLVASGANPPFAYIRTRQGTEEEIFASFVDLSQFSRMHHVLQDYAFFSTTEG
jgi:hypothetical protein